jgi:drug/metabolite transporter (DMT)-like permease
MREWMVFTGSLAMIALIITAFGLMLGIVKPADAVKHMGGILASVIILILVAVVLSNLWADISTWQWIGLTAVAIGIVLLRRPQPRSGKRREER